MEPARKRQRLSPASSPLYEGDLLNLSQEDIQVMDELEARLSSQPSSSSPTRRKLPPTTENEVDSRRAKRARLIAEALSQDGDQGNSTDDSRRDWEDLGEGTSAVGRSAEGSNSIPRTGFMTGFQCASNVHLDIDQVNESAEDAPSCDYSGWFDSKTPRLPIHFQTAKATSTSFVAPASNASSFPGFTKLSGKPGIIAPSAAALAKAEAMRKQWDQDIENTPPSTSLSPSKTSLFTPVLPVSPQRRALRTLENHSPGTPSPAGSSSASFISAGSLGSSSNKGKDSQFKSPLVSEASKLPHNRPPNSPLNPRQSGPQREISLPVTPLQLRSSASSMTGTPIRSGVPTTSHLRSKPSKFITPFKNGMKPSQTPQRPGSALVRLSRNNAVATPPVGLAPPSSGSLSTPSKAPKYTFFDLKKPPNRHTLASSGFHPQSYSLNDLQVLGIDPLELSQMTPTLALYYTFHTASDTPALVGTQMSQHLPRLGPDAAFEELLARGCSLATKAWVDNHWSLILWKLSGMVALEPEKESDPATKKWCWREVIRQLVYRYERELNSGSRPPLRLISTQDAPASCPMVLCVSNITWPELRIADEGVPLPELEVTDGWYRLRAQVDEPLARAVQKGTVKIGRKIAVAGARLSSERKEPVEILEAYNSVKLVLSGNSSHMAPWHAKLGFQQGPHVSTLHSLTRDGGPVAVMDVVVTKTYPVAYLEFLENEEGETYREGPRTEVEEAAVADKWKRRREVEASKLRVESEKRVTRYESYAERLERKAGSHFPPVGEDGPPDAVDDLYDALEDSDTASDAISRINPRNAGWLAQVIRERIVKDREAAVVEIERELDHICPPREVRNFRVLEVQDARTRRRPGHRTAQLTVWDVLKLTFTEGGEPGAFQVGQRFLVTSLTPSQSSAWMDCEPGSMVYLSTRRDTRWTKLKAAQM